MFKNIQNKLLLKKPLLWNLKIVPFTVLALAFHIIFFIIGYINGAIDFTETDNNYVYNLDNEIITFTGILISIITFIVWLVIYSRNNAFKSFYPKKNNALFKEWFLIFLFCVLNISYSVSYFYAADLKARNYFTEEEIHNRCEIIAMSSLFLEGSYKEGGYNWVKKDSVVDEMVQVQRDSFEFENKTYSLNSLLNKNIDKFSVFTSKKDSLNELKVKKWLVEDNREAVQTLFKEYFNIMKDHELQTNITPQQWLDLVYKAPDFTNYINVGKVERELRDTDSYNYYEGVESENIVEAPLVVEHDGSVLFDSISKSLKVINGAEYIYSKYYVSHKALLRSYGKISRAWENPTVNIEFILVIFYMAVGLSLLVFSFKVTSGRNWLIALVSIGIVGIISGIISFIVGNKYTFPILYMLIFIGILLYFIMILRSKTSKGISGITLNQLLWFLPSILPVVYFVGLDMAKDYSGYRSRYIGNKINIEQYPKIEWLEVNSICFMVLNLFILVLMVYILSRQIKKWKGIPEA